MEYVQPNLVKLSSSDFFIEKSWQDVRGFTVYDVNGEKIGTVEDFYVEREAHVVRFLEVSTGGFLKIGKKHFLIPVEEVTRDASEEGCVTVNHDRDKILASPDFDPSEVPSLNLERNIYAHYGRPYPEEVKSGAGSSTRKPPASEQQDNDTNVEKSGEEEGGGGIPTIVRQAAKGAAKGAAKKVLE